jgi:hypothetical protein
MLEIPVGKVQVSKSENSTLEMPEMVKACLALFNIALEMSKQ